MVNGVPQSNSWGLGVMLVVPVRTVKMVLKVRQEPKVLKGIRAMQGLGDRPARRAIKVIQGQLDHKAPKEIKVTLGPPGLLVQKVAKVIKETPAPWARLDGKVIRVILEQQGLKDFQA